jgi:hypothetical protein
MADTRQPDIVYCDGAGDGGIDIAVLESGSMTADDEEVLETRFGHFHIAIGGLPYEPMPL